MVCGLHVQQVIKERCHLAGAVLSCFSCFPKVNRTDVRAILNKVSHSGVFLSCVS